MARAKSRLGANPLKAPDVPGEPAVPVGPQRYYNRELSWLQFNSRVLEEANNECHPVLERLRFLSISASNLDEFYMVRAAGIIGQVAAGVGTLSHDGLTPKKQLVHINAFVTGLVKDKQDCWETLKRKLADSGIEIVSPDALSREERAQLKSIFMDQIFPILTPIAADPAHPFPFILNKGLTLAVSLEREGDDKLTNGLIPIPSSLQRFVRLQTASDDLAGVRYVQIEDVIGLFISKLFPGFAINAHGAFRVLRDSDIELAEEAEDLVATYESLLKRRRRGNVIRLEIDGQMPETMAQFVIDELEVGARSVFIKDGLLGLSDTAQLINSDRPELLFKPFNPRHPSGSRILKSHKGAKPRVKRYCTPI